ncbi:MAG TPA: acylphosphatase [Kofleriaceae bacterium]|nr:acylphosphatase [Kofleriaceae bacterium]
MRRIRAIVSGRVQGVSYRASTADKARQLGLAGWVKNLPDGSVELEAEGSPDQVAALVTWCHHGPPAARVDNVTVEELSPTGGDDFDVRY